MMFQPVVMVLFLVMVQGTVHDDEDDDKEKGLAHVCNPFGWDLL